MADSVTHAYPLRETLISCKNHPVRVSLFEPVGRERIARYPGVLAQVDETGVSVACFDVPVNVPAGTAATLEVACRGTVYWCHTETADGPCFVPNSIKLAWPATVQTGQQRRAPRVETNLPVHYFVPGSDRPHSVVMLNISTGGAALRGAEPISLGLQLALAFGLGSGLFFQDIEAEVLRVTATHDGGWIAGVRFVSLTADQQANLDQWVTERVRADPWAG
jgi:hypothetical protein